MLDDNWLGPGEQTVQMLPVNVRLDHRRGESPLTAYAVSAGDKEWSLLLINKDIKHDFAVRVRLYDDTSRRSSSFNGSLYVTQFSSAQYALNDDLSNPYPIRAQPPEQRVMSAKDAESVTLPSYSLTVVRGSNKEGLR
jgi:hypothetical protein